MENKNHFRISSVSQENQKSDFEEMGLKKTSSSIIYFYIIIVNLIYMNKFDKHKYNLNFRQQTMKDKKRHNLILI